MKNAIKIFVLAAALVLVLSSCQDIFTTSIYEDFYEVSYDNMTPEQTVTYAEDLLATGSAEELEEAYDEIVDMLPVDSEGELKLDDLDEEELELVELAADLAIGASGIGDAIFGALSALGGDTEGGEGDEDMFTELLGSIETENLEGAVSMFEALESNSEGDEPALTVEQYTNAAAAQILVAMDDIDALVEDGTITGMEDLDDTDPEQAAIIDDLNQAVEWAEAGGVMETLEGFGIEIPEF